MVATVGIKLYKNPVVDIAKVDSKQKNSCNFLLVFPENQTLVTFIT